MKRFIVHVLFFLFDVLALIAIGWTFKRTGEIFSATAAMADMIEYNTMLYLGFVCASIFLSAHLITLIEAFLPKLFNWSGFKKAVIAFWILIVIIAIGVTSAIKNQITHCGYFYCEGASTKMKLSHFAVYVLNKDTCHRLTTEKEKSKLSSIR